MIVMPPMARAQAAAWHGLMDIHDLLNYGWTLVGGQMVHLHCAERGYPPPRPTDDADTVLDIRANGDILRTFTGLLLNLGFAAAGISAEGVQHRWVRDDATLDVLLPEGVGERAGSRRGATGSPTISAPGGTQALQRSDSVTVDGREGFVRRPDLIGALVMKAAAHTAAADGAKRRHRFDFATLAALVAAADFRQAELNRTDRRRLRDMLLVTRADRTVIDEPGAAGSLDRLERALALP